MKYAVYGAGSLGLIFSAYLSKAGENFDLIDRNQKSIDAIKKNGIQVVGKANFNQKVSCMLDTDVKDKYDIIFLYTKQIGNIECIKKLSNFLTKDGVICTCQNGLPEKDVAAVLGDKRTFGCTIGWGATRKTYGVSELTTVDEKKYFSFDFGSFDGHKDEYFDEIVRICNVMGECHIEENFVGARWTKLLINSGFSGMSTVTGSTFGGASKNKKSRKVLQQILKECIDVGKAANIKVEPIQGKDVAKLLDYKGAIKKAISFFIIPIAIKKHALIKASMLQDIEKGIPCEVDYINGVVCEYGKKYKCPTPFNDLTVEIIHKIENKELTPSFENVKLYDKLFK